MDSQKDHHELMTRIAVFEATVNGKFDSVINHLAQLNGQTSKNTGSIEHLQAQDRDILSLVSRQKDQEKEYYEREAVRDKREDSWRKRWVDLLFGSLGWLLPVIVVSILLNGRAIAEFLGFAR